MSKKTLYTDSSSTETIKIELDEESDEVTITRQNKQRMPKTINSKINLIDDYDLFLLIIDHSNNRMISQAILMNHQHEMFDRLFDLSDPYCYIYLNQLNTEVLKTKDNQPIVFEHGWFEHGFAYLAVNKRLKLTTDDFICKYIKKY